MRGYWHSDCWRRERWLAIANVFVSVLRAEGAVLAGTEGFSVPARCFGFSPVAGRACGR